MSDSKELSSAQNLIGRADLHIHTNYSDGSKNVEEIIKQAKAEKLSTISITDHDNVGAIDEAIELGKSYGIEVISGVELSVEYNERDIHILAYFFDHKNKDLVEFLSFSRKNRLKRAEQMVQKLNNIKVPIKMETVLNQAGIGSVGRPHIASALVEEGLINTYQEAFYKYIGVGGPAYEKKFLLSPKEAIQLISKAGGLTFFAHPGKNTTDTDLLAFIQAGVDGIEVVHPSHNETMQKYYRSVVDQYFLLECGGSDYHGGKKNDEHTFGNYTVPLEVVEKMKHRLFK